MKKQKNKNIQKKFTGSGARVAISKSAPKKRYGEVEIENARLESFDNRFPDRRYEIEFTCPEFTCICPRSGFPDFATIKIKYVPDQKCVELKSLKLYINKFRTQYVFHEDVTNIILDDMVALLDPHEIEIIGDFNVRGNIKTIITARHQKANRIKNNRKSPRDGPPDQISPS